MRDKFKIHYFSRLVFGTVLALFVVGIALAFVIGDNDWLNTRADHHQGEISHADKAFCQKRPHQCK